MYQCSPPKDLPHGPRLSAKGAEIIGLLAQDLSMTEVARQLQIPPRTVAFHKYRIMEANGLQSSAELLPFAIRLGLLPLASSSDQVARQGCG